MIRVLLFLLALAGLSLGAVWLADRPGAVQATWLGYQVETSVMTALAGLVVLLVITIVLWSIVRTILRAPKSIRTARLDRRARRAYKAISNGIVAIATGNAQSAARFANEAQRLAPREPLALLLGAQAAQLAGNAGEATRVFKSMVERPDTKLLGLHGLFIEAQRRDDAGAARDCAEEAAKEAPKLAWAAEAVLQYRCAAGDWAGAVAALERNMRSGLVAKDVYKRQRAVLLTGRALANGTDRETALALAKEALKLSPGLVPAAALAAKLSIEAGQHRKATKIIEAAYAIAPHPDLVAVYASIVPNETKQERATRIKALARLAPNDPESAIAVARAAMDVQDFETARKALTPMLAMPTQRMAALMAELEEREGGDVGRAREWMRRALTATRDPTWTADGLVSATWMPASPTTGRIDAFEWRIPIADLSAGWPVIENEPETSAARLEAPATAAPASASGPAPATSEPTASVTTLSPAAAVEPAPASAPTPALASVSDPQPTVTVAPPASPDAEMLEAAARTATADAQDEASQAAPKDKAAAATT